YSVSHDACLYARHQSALLFLHLPVATVFSPAPLHDALPILQPFSALRAAEGTGRYRSLARGELRAGVVQAALRPGPQLAARQRPDRKRTRLNSSHVKN